MYNIRMAKIGFIGGGNMAEAIIKGIIENTRFRPDEDIMVSDPNDSRLDYLGKTYNVITSPSNTDVADRSGIIVLAVKPQNMDEVVEEISSLITEEKTIMSIAAGVTLSYLSSRLNTKKIIRVMPNTPALVQEGMSVMSLCECFPDEGIRIARDILMSFGKVITLPEKYMDAVTALSGSGPAFIAFFIETMIKAGIETGLSEEDARVLAVQTAIGTARLLESGMEPARLREMVTSPGGTTAAGLRSFEQNNFAGIVAEALKAAKKRSEELGKTK